MAGGSALIGTGFIAPVHLEAMRRLRRNVVGVLGSKPERSQQAAKTLGIPRPYADLDALLADPDVATVHITSPNRLHHEACRQALSAGKHVVCEKPLAMTSGETSDLVQQASRSRSVAAVCYNIRFYPLCLEARARIEAGELGDIFHITGSYEQDWLLYDTDYNWRVEAEEGGALRAVADIGTHWLDLVQFVAGQSVRAVCADLKTVHPTRQKPLGPVETFQGKFGARPAVERVAIATEDYGSVLLAFERGARGCFTVSQVCAGRKNSVRFEVAGSRGSLAWDSERPNELWLGHRDRPNELLVRDPALMKDTVRPYTNYPGGHNEGFPDTFKQLFRAIYATIDGTPAAFPTFADGHREVVLCEAIAASQRERRWVEV